MVSPSRQRQQTAASQALPRPGARRSQGGGGLRALINYLYVHLCLILSITWLLYHIQEACLYWVKLFILVLIQ